MATGDTSTETAAESYECEICGQTFNSTRARAAHRAQSHTTAERRVVLIDAINELATSLGSTPTFREMRKHGKYSANVYHNQFGSWNNALREAGFEPNKSRNLTESELLTELQRLADEQGSAPAKTYMNKHGQYSAEPYERRFGSWNNALREAGFEPNRSPSTNLTESQLLAELQRSQRKRAVMRDFHSCRICFRPAESLSQDVHVHHITPARDFGAHDDTVDTDYDAMNDLSNLISLCPHCHWMFEGKWRSCTPTEFAVRGRHALTQRTR